MKYSLCTLLIALAVVPPLLAWLFVHDLTKKDLAKLQGKWSPISTELMHRDRTPEINTARIYTVTGNEFTEQDTHVVTFTIDASKVPKTIELTGSRGGGSLGIYKLEGDKLTICLETGSDVRPTEFTTTEADGNLTVWKRAK